MNRITTAVALALLSPSVGLAADLTLGARTDVLYDDNVLATDRDETEDGEVLFSPSIGLSARSGVADGEIHFTPTYEFFFDQKDLRGLNYTTDGRVAWRPTARTSIELSDKFLRYRSLRLLSGEQGGTPAETGERDRFWRNVGQIAASHRLTPVDTVQVSGNVAFWEFDDEDRFDQRTYTGGLNYQRAVSRVLTLGAGVSYSRLHIEQRIGTPARETDYYNFSLIADYVPADTFTVHLSAGPTYVKQPRVRTPASLVRGQLYRFSGNDILVGLVPSTCPTLLSGEFFDGPGCNFIGIDPVAQSLVYSQLIQRALDPVSIVGFVEDRDELTYFADVTVQREWQTTTLLATYRRDQGSGSAAGFSTVSDLVELRGVLRPRREMSITAAVGWENRKETQSGRQFVTTLATVPGSGTLPAINNLVPSGLAAVATSQRVESLTARLNAGYQVTARARLEATVTWREQTATTASFFNDYERLQVMLGINVELDPIRW